MIMLLLLQSLLRNVGHAYLMDYTSQVLRELHPNK